MKGLGLALRMLRRDWRTGEMRVLLLAVVIAVASLTSVNVFTDRVERAIARQANTLLGGDLVVRSDHPIPQRYSDEARARGLQTAASLEFPSMVMAGERNALVMVKAVTDGYPLRGQLQLADRPLGPERAATGIPARGGVWVERALLDKLGIDVGATLAVGHSELKITAILTRDPARAGGDLFSLAPRLLINMADLAATGLVQPHSRVKHYLYLAGHAELVARYRPVLEGWLTTGEQLLGIEEARPEMRSAMRQARRFLGLAALVSLLLAGVAIAMAARRFVHSHLDGCAVMRCLGASQSLIMQIHVGQLMLAGIGASIVGVLAGYLAQAGLVTILDTLLETELPAPSLAPAGWGIATGLVTLAGFGVPPLLRLKSVPALRVLRREMGGQRTRNAALYGAALAAFSLLVFLQADDARVTGYVLGGTAVTLLLLGLLAWLMILGLKRIRGRAGVAWRFGVANIARRGGTSIVQVVGFGLGIMALLLLTLVRTELLEQWQQQLPADAPNRFLINIQPQQVDAVRQFLAAEGLPAIQLLPVVRGRLIRINGKPVSAEDYREEHAKRLVTHEFNLSWAAELRDDNAIVAGRWWRRDDQGKPYVSLESGIARVLGLSLGDRLTWRIGSSELSAEIVSLRRVKWDSFRANFFVLAAPGLLEPFPATWITSFHLPGEREPLLNRLVQRFPNVTVIDVDRLMAQVRAIVERTILAVEYVFLFTLLAGLMVMFAAIHATMDERIREIAILRTLGARRKELLQGIMAEFAGLGLLAGVVAASAAALTGHLLASQLFNLSYVPSPLIWLTGIATGTLGIGLAGTWSTRTVLRHPPVRTLRES